MRGDIFRLRALRDVHGHEQRGVRYAVVVQSDHLPLSTLLVAPTSTGRPGTSFRPQVDIAGEPTRVLVEQTSAVDPETRLGAFAGRLTADEMLAVDQAVLDVLGLR